MGTDDLFHKRKAKRSADLARRKAKRAPYSRVLIVCEGEKTEPYYLQGLRDRYRISTANIDITGECRSDPGSLVAYARERYQRENKSGDTFDKVFCVFDKDTHGNYDQALTALQLQKPSAVFHAITSVPCFEYWLLLHFIHTTKPYETLPGNSPANQVLTELKAYLPNYAKGQRGLFVKLEDQLEFAKYNAARALTAAEGSHTDNPTTRMHELVAFLQTLKAN